MNESFCEESKQSVHFNLDVKDLRSTYIANCVLNNFLTYTAVMLNIITIYAIRKSSSLAKTLKTLLLSLAVSDVGVGLFVQPFYTSLLVNSLQQNSPRCYTYLAFKFTVLLFSASSFLSVVAVSVDRLLAVHLHLRYQELVTHKRVIAVVISIWVSSGIVSLLTWWSLRHIQNLIISISGVIGLLLTAVVYIRIYLVARRHKNQMQILQLQQVEAMNEMANFASLIKSAVGIFYIYFVFLACYLPYFIGVAALRNHDRIIPLETFVLFSVTLVFLNSSLNPVIYCWKIRHIRRAVMDILRNVTWNRNQP